MSISYDRIKNVKNSNCSFDHNDIWSQVSDCWSRFHSLLWVFITLSYYNIISECFLISLLITWSVNISYFDCYVFTFSPSRRLYTEQLICQCTADPCIPGFHQGTVGHLACLATSSYTLPGKIKNKFRSVTVQQSPVQTFRQTWQLCTLWVVCLFCVFDLMTGQRSQSVC